MSVLILASLAVPGGLAAFLTVGRKRVSLAIGALAAALTVIAAAQISVGDAVPLAGAVVAGSDGLRTIALAWSAGIALIGTADALVGTGTAFGPSLIGLGTGVVALSVADAGTGFALLTAGGIAAALGPLAWQRRAPTDLAHLGLRLLRPLTLAGALALAGVAWGASAVGPFAPIAQAETTSPSMEIGIGLGLLAVVTGVAIRLGAIPAHVWASRLVGAGSTASIPGALGWGAAGFALVALGWVDVTIAPSAAPLFVERGLIAFVAAASILLGGLAAILHDDIEHILGYSIVQDAGVALLAFGLIRPDTADAGRDWLVGMVAVKTGFAAWVLVTRSTFGVHRLPELRGWARRAPILGLAAGLVLVGTVGLPGMATFAARGVLVGRVIAAPIDLFVLIGAFASIAYLGRIIVVGLDAPSEAVRGVAGARPRLRGVRPAGWTRGSIVAIVVAVPDAIRANRLALAAGSALLAAVIGLAVATVGLGGPVADQAVTGTPIGSGLVVRPG